MLHFYDRATLTEALTLPLDPALHRLLAERIAALGEDLIDWTEYLVVEPGDTEEDVIHHVGFSPLVNPLDGLRYPDPAYEPHWDYLAHHDGWFEIMQTFGSTYAMILLVQDAENVPCLFRDMCCDFATR